MSSAPWQASTNSDTTFSMTQDEERNDRKGAFAHARETATSRDILLFLIGLRIVNALSVKTFFQPDEYFQSLEPAWEIAFGADSGAWITWEWKNNLRSSIHPALFAGVYWLSSYLSSILKLPQDSHAEFLIATPKVTQAAFAALGDFYTWKLAKRVYGRESNEAWVALALTTCSPWQWFCSTRTLSNCLETTLTIAALSLWPWQWSWSRTDDERSDESKSRVQEDLHSGHELTKLRCCLSLAALACVLRPTNLLIWLCIGYFSLFHLGSAGHSVPFRWADLLIWNHISSSTLLPATQRAWKVLVREVAFCGISILALSVLVDRYYYQEWTFPPLRFLYFNIAQSLAIFYGRNDWHYYLTQGYPLLLTTALPFAVIGLYQTLRNSPQSSATPLPLSATVPYVLSATALIVPSTLSFISHKEVRFIYPLLPLLHIIASPPIATFFRGSSPPKRLLLISLLLTNFFIAFFATVLHQPAPITILAYLRTQHTAHYLSQPPSYALSPAPSTMTVGFLTPCHSTPWRSHLIYPGIKAWALTCNPPLNLNSSERGIYLDEADAFYANPSGFLNTHLGPPIKSPLIGRAPHSPVVLDQGWDGKEGRKRWPEYLVFFAQLEPEMRGLLRGSAYTECWREWNSYGHDDWRRRGDLVVWCLNGREGKKKAKRKGRTASG